LPYCLPGSIRDFLRHRGDRDKHAPTLLQKESVVRRVALSHALPQRARVHRRRRTRASWLLGSFETSCRTLCSHLMATSILKFYWGSASTSGAVCNTENRKQPEALFDVVLNTDRGCERHSRVLGIFYPCLSRLRILALVLSANYGLLSQS
jgi:hypothetical protein